MDDYAFIGLEPTKESQTVLVIWSAGSEEAGLQNLVSFLKHYGCTTVVENDERLLVSNHSTSAFDLVVSGVVPPYTLVHNPDLLAEILRVVKPSGRVVLRQLVSDVAPLATTLTLAGFVQVLETKEIVLSIGTPASDSMKRLVEFTCRKPNYEVGSLKKLSFASSVPAQSVSSVWTLNSTVEDDVELIDSDQLLDEDDLVKPTTESLKVCGSTGKRQACKNCVCGLADELEQENKEKTPTAQKPATSACGSCYLGDAFRCASCPYLGMPAFKPGEKIQLSERQLNPDL
nr:EOG090X0FGQ [Triops cancriformis]